MLAMIGVLQCCPKKSKMQLGTLTVIRAVADDIYAEHLTYCSKHILPLLSMCFTTLLVHGILPNAMISVILVPIIKDKTGKITTD